MEKKHLTLQDRQSIEQMLNAKKNFVEIALALDKNKSTISREVRGHNCGFLLRINACSKNIRRDLTAYYVSFRYGSNFPEKIFWPSFDKLNATVELH